MKGLVAGWRDDDELGALAAIVSEDALAGCYVSAEALREAAGDGRAELEIDEATGWVTVMADVGVALLEPVRTSCPDLDLEAARDLALARLGESRPWTLEPDVFAAAAVVRHDGFRTVVSIAGAPDSVFSGRVPRRRAALLAHEEAVDRRASGFGLGDIPESVLAHYPAIRIAYERGPAREHSSATRSISYRSGMSRVGDLSASAASGVPTGVVISELNARAKAALLEANANGVRFFVDSGAFAARRDGAAPVDFDSVCSAYRDLADRAAHPELLSVVAPDRVGDRDGTLELLAAYRTDLMALLDRGVELLVPLHRHVPASAGDTVYSLADTYRETVRVLGTDRFRCALPARVSVFTETEILEFVRDAQPARLHLLGIGSSAELPMRLRRLGAVCEGLDVSTDACQFRAGLGRGRPLQQIIDVDLAAASRIAVLHGSVASDRTPLLGGDAEPAETEAQSTLFAAGPVSGEVLEPDFDITEYLHDLYNSPGFLDRDDAVDLAARLTEDPRTRESIILAALAVVDSEDRSAEDVARSIAGRALEDDRDTDAAFGSGRVFGSPLGYTLDRFFPDDRVVDRVVYSMLVEDATETLRRRVRTDAVAECERNREFWEGWDVRVEHPFAAGIGEPYRDSDGETTRLADGSRLSWLERIAWAGRATEESGGVALFAGTQETSESYVVAHGRVARFDSVDLAREAFRDFTSPGLAAWLERAALVREAAASIGDPALEPASPSAPALTLAPPPSRTRIEDFGEVIEGARKHYAAAYRDLLAFAADVDVESVPLSKSWPEPNYQRLIDEGSDPWVVAMIRSIRDALPPKPVRSWKVSTWSRQVKRLRELGVELLESDETRERFDAKLSERGNSDLKAELVGRAELYVHAGHSRSLKGLTMVQRAFGVWTGERFDAERLRWVIERGPLANSKAWPSRIAMADEKSEAIKAFLEIHAKAVTKTAKSSPFEVWQYKHHKGFYIGARFGRDQVELLRFDTLAEARAYTRDHNAELAEMLERQRLIPSERRPADEPREGPPRRDADVTVAEFADAFQFRGCQFGNWVEGDRRQTDLNNAHDALQDLADILGVTPDSLSLGGQLGLAFGARGRGGNSGVAHYETRQVVINLTKTRGAGSLAHEWFHALDNAVARLAGGRDGFATENPRLAATGVSAGTGEAFARLGRAIRATGLTSRSAVLDRRRRNDYWSTGRELGARAFEAFVIARLAECGVTNDYLANIVTEQEWEMSSRFSSLPPGRSYPYPTAAELVTLVPAFKDLVESIDWPGRQASPNRLASSGLEAGPGVLDTMMPDVAQDVPDAFGVRRATDDRTGSPLWRVEADTSDSDTWERARILGGVCSTATEEPSFEFRHPGNARAFVDANARAAAAAVASSEPAQPESSIEANGTIASGSPHEPFTIILPDVPATVDVLPSVPDRPEEPDLRAAAKPAPTDLLTSTSAPTPAASEPPPASIAGDSTREAPGDPAPGVEEPLPPGHSADDVRRVRLSLRVRDELLGTSPASESDEGLEQAEVTAREVASWLSRQGPAVLSELEGLGSSDILSRALAPQVAPVAPTPPPSEQRQAPRAALQLTLGL